MKKCPKCGKTKSVTKAVRSAVKMGGTFICICSACKTQFSITYDDVYPSKKVSVRVVGSGNNKLNYVTINPNDYKYRRMYGLCVICGEPSYLSRTLCLKCKEQGLRAEEA